MQSSRPTAAHLGLILHYMFVDIRDLSYEPGHEEWINKLADFAEIIPYQLINRDDDYMDGIVAGIRKWAKTDPRAARYSAVLDMTSDQVIETLLPNHALGAATRVKTIDDARRIAEASEGRLHEQQIWVLKCLADGEKTFDDLREAFGYGEQYPGEWHQRFVDLREKGLIATDKHCRPHRHSITLKGREILDAAVMNSMVIAGAN